MTNLFSPIKFLFVIFLSWACFHFVATADSASEFFKLIPSDSNALDEFGQSVAISGNLMAIGSPNEDSGGTNMGAAYIYELFGNTWVFQTKIVPADGQAGDTFGTAISMSSNLLLVGSKSHDINGVSNVGAAYVYANTSGNVWEEQAMLSSFDGLVGDAFGSAVAIDGNVAVVAASYHDVSGFSNSGAAYVFANSSANNWVFQSKIYSSSPRTNAYFGESVSVSGNRVAVGAYKDSLANSSAGSVYIYENSSSNIW